MSNQDIVRAWKDENYRNNMSSKEQEQLPAHPAGDIELPDELLDQVAGGELASSAQRGTAGCCGTNDTCFVGCIITGVLCKSLA